MQDTAKKKLVYRGESVTKLLGVPNEPGDMNFFFANPFFL